MSCLLYKLFDVTDNDVDLQGLRGVADVEVEATGAIFMSAQQSVCCALKAGSRNRQVRCVSFPI